MLVRWDLPLPSLSLQPQDPPGTKGSRLRAPVLETALDLCRECRKLCGWLRQKAMLVLGSAGRYVMPLPNFGEASGDFS